VISVRLEGMKELEAKLLQLERKVSKKIVRSAVRKAQKALIPTIKGYLEGISTGGGMAQKISKALTVRAAKRNRKGSYAVHVTLNPDPSFLSYPQGSSSNLATRQTSGKRSYAPAAIELGHGKNKEQAARPYMRPAADATVNQRIRILTKEVATGIAKIWGKK